MTKSEGQGFEVLMVLCDSLARKLGEAESKAYLAGLSDEDLSSMAMAMSSANRAVHGEPDLITEALAERVAPAEDEDADGEPSVAMCQKSWVGSVPTEMHYCVRRENHPPPCSEWMFDSDSTPGSPS